MDENNIEQQYFLTESSREIWTGCRIGRKMSLLKNDYRLSAFRILSDANILENESSGICCRRICLEQATHKIHTPNVLMLMQKAMGIILTLLWYPARGMAIARFRKPRPNKHQPCRAAFPDSHQHAMCTSLKTWVDGPAKICAWWNHGQ